MVSKDQTFLSEFLYRLEKISQSSRVVEIGCLTTVAAKGLSQAGPAEFARGPHSRSISNR